MALFTGRPSTITGPNARLKSFEGDGDLTPRERGILARIVDGSSSKEIALTLAISPRTVEFHRANLLKKCRAKNTADLVRRALGE
ncbi:MAG: LuxR C-terminal-related transcriptional regulator [Hyphomicrobium sp.]